MKSHFAITLMIKSSRLCIPEHFPYMINSLKKLETFTWNMTLNSTIIAYWTMKQHISFIHLILLLQYIETLWHNMPYIITQWWHWDALFNSRSAPSVDIVVAVYISVTLLVETLTTGFEADVITLFFLLTQKHLQFLKILLWNQYQTIIVSNVEKRSSCFVPLFSTLKPFCFSSNWALVYRASSCFLKAD